MKLRHLGVIGAAGLLAVGTTIMPAVAQSPPPVKILKIGVELPLSGNEAVNGEPTKNGVDLLTQQVNAAGGVGAVDGKGGWLLSLNVQDDVLVGKHDPVQGAANVHTLIDDQLVFGMVGPFNSNVARAEIPITNEAVLPQCSPANTAIDLTQVGSEKYRTPDNVDFRNYFRVATPDSIQGAGLAQYAFNDLGKKAAWVVDDNEAFGKGVADSFTAEFQRLGGKELKRDHNDITKNKDFSALVTAAKGLNPDVVFFGGTQPTGGGELRKAMGAQDLLAIPYVGPDGITDLVGADIKGSYINLAGVENAGNTFGSVAGVKDPTELGPKPEPVKFATDYAAAFGGRQPGAYSAMGYACGQLLVAFLERALAAGADALDINALRVAVRDQAFAGNAVDTAVGPLTVDPNGDSGTWLSLYKTDMTIDSPNGGWAFIRQQNFAP